MNVIIGKNIKKIGGKAFFGDSSLKQVDFRFKVLIKIGTKAFTKTHKKLKIKIPQSKKKSYKRFLKESSRG